MNETDSLLTICEVRKHFDRPDGKSLEVLRGVSFNLGPNQMMALVGPNGCGKTTLLNIIAGDLQADSGAVRLDGANLLSFPAHRRARIIGRVHQESYKSMASELTVGEVLAIARQRGHRLSCAFPHCSEAIGEIGLLSPPIADFLASKASLPTEVLSGGERQLLALAVAVLGNPVLMLLDEHKASLDATHDAVVDELLTRFIRTRRCAAIAATHNSEWVNSVCTCVGRFESGAVTVSEVRAGSH